MNEPAKHINNVEGRAGGRMNDAVQRNKNIVHEKTHFHKNRVPCGSDVNDPGPGAGSR